MLSRKRSCWHQLCKEFRHRCPKSHFRRSYSARSSAVRSAKLQGFNSVWSHKEHFLLWIRGRQRQHFGPKSRVPDLFQRRDHAYFSLEAKKLQWYTPPPRQHHDLLDAAAKVGAVEERVGYSFKNKMTCIEALKTSGDFSPLYFKGVIHEIDRNNRLALLGDRILSLALCEIWFSTGRTPAAYNRMRIDVETRSALYNKGRSLNLHKSIIISNTSTSPTPNNIAETFEAILGAIYLDSGHDVQAVKNVLRNLGFDNHKLLKIGEDTIPESTIQNDLHVLDTKRPSARQLDDKPAIPTQKTANVTIEATGSKSRSLLLESGRKLVHLWTGFFSSDVKSSGRKDTAFSPNLSVREGVESTQASTLLNDTKPVLDESRGNVTQPSIATSQSSPDSLADLKIEPKIFTKPESQRATTMTAELPAAPPQQFTTAGTEKPANPLQTSLDQREQEKEIWAKANREAMVKAHEMVARMRKNGAKVTYNDIFPRMWKKMQLRVIQEIKENRMRMIKEEKKRIALQAQKKAEKAYAWQKIVEAAAKQKRVNEALIAQKKKASEPFKTPNKGDLVATAQKKANESSVPPKPASGPSTMQTKIIEASAVEKKEGEVSAAQERVKEVPKTERKPDETSTTKMKSDKCLKNETPGTQKKVEEASSTTQKKSAKGSIGPKSAPVLEPPREVKAAIVEPKTENSSLDLTSHELERRAVALSATIEQLGTAIEKIVEHTRKKPQTETRSPPASTPTPEPGESEQNPKSNLKDTALNSAVNDSQPPQEVPDISQKSKLQRDLEKPGSQTDTEPVVFESEMQMLMADLTGNDDSKFNEPVGMNRSPKQEGSDVQMFPALNADIEKATHNSAEEDQRKENSEDAKAERKRRRKAMAISDEYAFLARKIADRS